MPDLEQVISIAKQQIGKPYVWGARGPDSFDCSGLWDYSFQKAGWNLNWGNTFTQINWGTEVPWENRARGDLIFTENDNHVMMYLGNGKILEAATVGEPVHIIDEYVKPGGGEYAPSHVRRMGTDNNPGTEDASWENLIPGDSQAQELGKAMKQLENMFNFFNKVAQHLLDPKFWIRFSFVVVGGIVMLIALIVLIDHYTGGKVSDAGKQGIKKGSDYLESSANKMSNQTQTLMKGTSDE